MGGTFDPVHVGHLRTAEEAYEELGLEQVMFIPSSDPPHKPGLVVLEFEHRWRMLQLAIAGNPRFVLSDIERRMPGKSYTVNTLRALRKEFPDRELFFLVGLDAFLEIDTWFRFVEIFRLARIAVLRRPGYGESDLEQVLSRKVFDGYRKDPETGAFVHPEMLPVHYLGNAPLEVSSTRIRQLAAEGRSIRYLVPPEVMGYINEKKLYVNAGGIEERRCQTR